MQREDMPRSYDVGVTTATSLAAAIAERTQPDNAAPWDPVGLQLGDPESRVESVAVCHEVTEAVVETLQTRPVDLLVTYHPLLFKPTNRILSGQSAEARAYALIRLGVSLLVTHTDFDAAPGGTADALASVLSLRDVTAFGGDLELGLPDIGRYGEFEGTLAVLDAMVSDAFGSSGLRITGDRSSDLKRVAVIPGSGSDYVLAASEVADALVTGDVPHHTTVRAQDLGLCIVDPGHTATERPGMGALVAMIGEMVEVTQDLTHLDPKTWS